MADTTKIVAAGVTGTGLLFMYCGWKNKSILSAIQTLVKGTAPSSAASLGASINANTVSTSSSSSSGSASAAAGDTGASTVEAVKNQTIGKILAAPYGWSTGTEWTDLVSLWNQESGWNNLAQNPNSGAFGIAQALGHGTASTAGKYGNEYPSEAANNGSASAQIAWGLSYIKATYGDPIAAWAHEVSDGWY
jgi:resuscitation-promoting factor RpfB